MVMFSSTKLGEFVREEIVNVLIPTELPTESANTMSHRTGKRPSFAIATASLTPEPSRTGIVRPSLFERKKRLP